MRAAAERLSEITALMAALPDDKDDEADESDLAAEAEIGFGPWKLAAEGAPRT
jgi:hypothetical protein